MRLGCGCRRHRSGASLHSGPEIGGRSRRHGSLWAEHCGIKRIAFAQKGSYGRETTDVQREWGTVLLPDVEIEEDEKRDGGWLVGEGGLVGEGKEGSWGRDGVLVHNLAARE